MSEKVFRFGADYYPEQWQEYRWSIDAGLMAEAGFNVVRLAEFAWSKMEPTPGVFDFDWLDRAIDILYAQGMSVVLGTPTASPPPWVMHQHPDAFRVDENGVAQSYGLRREYCPNNPTYHELSRRIVTAMAQHYAGHPAVIGWQIDNEFGDRCYCPVCRSRFQEWLREKYSTLEILNSTWGTTFWSHIYLNWDEIPVPLVTIRASNPSLALDFYRFASDSYVRYQRMQIDLIRQYAPGTPITHNLMGMGYPQLDYFEFARDLDFVSWDNYPRMQWTFGNEPESAAIALSHRAMHGIKRKNFWVMEQQSGSGGWEIVSTAPRPGEIRLWAYQAIAHGADGIVFFRWRTARHGTEQYWHGILDHHAQPGRRYAEVKCMGEEIRRVGTQILNSQPAADVAILHSYDTRFAFQIQANNPHFRYEEHILNIFRAFHGKGIPADVIAADADLSAYKLVVLPAMYVLTEEVAENVTRFVENGGTLIVTARTGVKDQYNVVVERYLPGLLSDLCGVTVAEYDSIPADRAIPLELNGDTNVNGASARLWCDVLTPTTAATVATYTQDYYAGQPAITHNRVGRGHVVTIGTFGDAALYAALLPWFSTLAGVAPLMDVPDGVEVTQRVNGEKRITFVLNHTTEPKTVIVPPASSVLLSSQPDSGGAVTIPARDLIIFTVE